jgi:hypothetical protein
MSDGDVRSDALVFFGATGDLARRKIFPALQAMVKRGHFDVPVIGVAKAGWSLEQLQARAKDSPEEHGGLDPVAFDTLCGLLRYVDGDYRDVSWSSSPRWARRTRASSSRSRSTTTSSPRGSSTAPCWSLRRGIDLDLRPPRNGPWPFGVSREYGDGNLLAPRSAMTNGQPRRGASKRSREPAWWQTHGPDRNGRTPRIRLGHEVWSGRVRYAVGGAHSCSGDG